MNKHNTNNSFLSRFIPWIIPLFVPIYLVFLPVIFTNYPALALVILFIPGLLYHSNVPFYYLCEAVRITRKRILLMESYIDKPDIHQRNCFLDLFFNRIVQNADINIPLNFRTIDQWKEAFDELVLNIDKLDVVGIDELKAPEYHVYFYLDVNPLVL